MSNTIIYQNTTKEPHKIIVSWLNRLLTNYQSGFWDATVKNMLVTSFIDTTRCFVQELYDLDGNTHKGTLVVMNFDTVNHLLVIFDNLGNPILYNNSDVFRVFEINDVGFLNKFWVGTRLDLFNVGGTKECELLLMHEFRYGIKNVALNIFSLSGEILYKGLVDIDYIDRESSTYALEIKPLEHYPKYQVTNISDEQIIARIPILDSFSMEFKIPSKQSIQIPVTDWSTNYFRLATNLGGLVYKKL